MPTPTPRYDDMPTWGLPVVGRPIVTPHESATDRLAGRAATLLGWTISLFAAAAVAEIARYVMLLVSRDRLIAPAVLAVSDASVWCLSLLAVGFGLVTSLACVSWLVRARRSAYADHGSLDPRRTRTLYLGALVPVVNLVLAGVFLTEFARQSARRWDVERVLPWWWTAWVANWVLIAATVGLRFADGIQARANGVVVTALADVVAAVVAGLTLALIRRAEDRTLRGDDRRLTRWTVAPDSVDLAR
ncbi:MAG: DUF4328 domain-containing protein [Rhodococcus sp. (in: high G+C Gram-positive bacteria)]